MPRNHKIVFRQGTTTPGAPNFEVGEPAWDKLAKKLYIKAEDGTMVEIAGGGGGSVTIDASAADILSASGGAISADDLGADMLWGWDDSAGKAIGFTLGTGLSTDGTTLNVTGGGGSVGLDPVIAGMIF